jgi:uncharacterized repeat protein (TIGR02543 family)
MSATTATYTIEQIITLPTPEKTAYTFAGWYDNAELTGDAVAELAAGSTGDKAYYAKWTATEYAIAYEVNGGTMSATNATYTVNDSVTLPTPERERYTFAGWYDNAELTGTAVTEIATGSTGNKIYYAKWEDVLYSVTVAEAQNGSATVSAESAKYGSEITVTVTPSDGYQLDSIAVNGTAITGNTFTLEQDTTVTVTFKEIVMFSVTVTESKYGTITVSETTAAENTVITVTATPNSGYTLVAILVNGQQIEGTTFTLTEDCTVSARFKKDDSETTGETSSSGCGGVITSASALLGVAALGVATVLLKKKKED